MMKNNIYQHWLSSVITWLQPLLHCGHVVRFFTKHVNNIVCTVINALCCVHLSLMVETVINAQQVVEGCVMDLTFAHTAAFACLLYLFI